MNMNAETNDLVEIEVSDLKFTAPQGLKYQDINEEFVSPDAQIGGILCLDEDGKEVYNYGLNDTDKPEVSVRNDGAVLIIDETPWFLNSLVKEAKLDGDFTAVYSLKPSEIVEVLEKQGFTAKLNELLAGFGRKIKGLFSRQSLEDQDVVSETESEDKTNEVGDETPAGVFARIKSRFTSFFTSLKTDEDISIDDEVDMSDEIINEPELQEVPELSEELEESEEQSDSLDVESEASNDDELVVEADESIEKAA